MTVEILTPHGLCAGVNAAIARALKLQNVYFLHPLVHNEIVTGDLRALGHRLVSRLEDVPAGATLVISAHGTTPALRAAAEARGVRLVDTTCPFVAKVHAAARQLVAEGRTLVVLGDPRHAEVAGIVGEVPPEACRVLRSDEPIAVLGLPAGAKLGVVSQTTMNADDVARRVDELRAQYDVETLAEVCHATKDRQDAVKEFCRRHAADAASTALVVLGSPNSSNTARLTEVAAAGGIHAFRAGTLAELAALDLKGAETVGVTSGASTPERFFDEAVRQLKNVPLHVAIIMDGNGRWATQRGLKRGEGHIAGAETLVNVLRWCGDRGIRYLTVYAFSTENWKRPREEVEGLMKLFVKMLKSKALDLQTNQVRFRMIGRRGDLPADLRAEVEKLEAETASFTREFIVAISYGGRAEIVDAVNAALAKGVPVTEETFRSFLYAPEVPDPDLVIRTSGEQRTSNFLLWESAYSEYHFTTTLWPDFSEADFDRALADYAGRHRRKGGV